MIAAPRKTPTAANGVIEYACEPGEVVPAALRTRLRWDWRHDAAAADVMQEYGLSLPKDRELIRQLAVTRVAWGKPEWL